MAFDFFFFFFVAVPPRAGCRQMAQYAPWMRASAATPQVREEMGLATRAGRLKKTDERRRGVWTCVYMRERGVVSL